MAVRIHEITMANKDIVCVEIRDPEIVEGNMAGPLTPMPAYDYNTRYTLTNPRSGLLERGFVRGANKDYFRFDDTRPDLYYERAAGDVAANWGPIGARTVTNVWRKSFPYQSGYCEGTSGGHCNIAVFKHFVYLKLDGNLAQGSYTITPPAGTGLSAVPFVFNHKVTRCSSIHVTQVGMRPSDAAKTAYLSVWIPGAPNEGEIAFDSTEFTIIDADGVVDYGSLPVVHRVDGHTLEENDLTLNWYASTNYPSLKITNITNAAAAAYTYSGTGFVPVNGEVVMFRGMLGGMSQLEYWNAILTNVNTTAKTFNAYIVTHPNGNWDSRYGGRIVLRSADTTANTITSLVPHNWATGQGPVHVHFATGTVGGLTERINYWVRKIDDYTLSLHTSSADASSDTARVDLTSFSGNPFVYGVTTDTTAFSPYSDVSFLDEYENRMYRCCVKNRPGTNVYGLDFSEWMMTADPGLFRLWVPDIGVSDPFRVDDDVWWDVAKNACGGIYNHRNGAALDGRFGWTRPLSFRGDVAMSKQPASWSSEAGIVGSGNALSSAVTDHPICMTSETFTDWFGSYHDAGDWDTFSCAHLYEFVNLLDVLMDRAPPEVRSQGFFGTPKSSAVLGELYAGTDDMPDIFHAAAWIFDAYRRLQREDGSVGGGLGYSAGGYTDTGSGPSWLPVPSGMTGAVVYAPDHHSNFCYAAAAAKFAIICLDEGFGSLGAVYRQSAIDAWDWAEPIFLDREGIDVTGAHDAFYLTECDLRNLPRSEPYVITSADAGTDILTVTAQLNIGYWPVRVTLGSLVGPVAGVTYFARPLSNFTLSLHPTEVDAVNDTARVNVTTGGTGTVYVVLSDTQYTEGRDLIHGHYARGARRAAAGTLFRLTGEAEYGDIAGVPMIGQSTQGWNGNAMWEYAHASAADPATRTALMSSFIGPGLHYEMDYSLGDIGYRNQGYKEVFSIPMSAEYRQLLWYLIAIEEEGTASPPYTREEVLNVLQAGRHFQHGANQNGICMTHGLGAPRVMETTLHEDSMRIGVDCPPGITNYGWDPGFFANGANLFSGDSPLVPVVEHLTGLYEDNYGSKRVYEPYRATVPRMEFLVENPYWIHQNEYTFHQTITPDWAIAQWLHAHDGNTYSGGPPAEPGTVITMHWGEAPGEPEPEDPPTMTSSSSVSVAENAALAHTLTASAPSTFAITGGADDIFFEVFGAATLRWSEDGAANYESPMDDDADNVYEVEVTPTTTPGGTVGTPQAIAVTVTDVLDTPPVMTSGNTASVAENATLAHALTANMTVTYAITGGADAAKFEISGTTLRWTGNATKDYEVPDDADLDRAYVVQVTPTHAVTGAGSAQTITVTLTDVADTAGYTTTSAHFDGATRLVRGGGLTGAVNGPVAIFSVWIKAGNDVTGSKRILISEFGAVTFHRSTSNKITVAIPSPTGPAISFPSVASVLVASGWTHILYSFDTVAGSSRLYLNDVLDTTSTNVGGDLLKYVHTNWGVGAQTDGFSFFNGDMADLYFNTVEWLDFSVEANRRKFITTDLKPVDLGANGQLPTGNAPILFLNGGAAGFTTNKGTGGDFTVAAGTLTNGPTIP